MKSSCFFFLEKNKLVRGALLYLFLFFVCFFRVLLDANSWILVITATQCISESCQVASME